VKGKIERSPGLNILETVNSPADLTNISREDLPRLAAEIRKLIIEVVSKTGGHLASNLGTVELAIAIHLVFNNLGDKIIWDVGHQAYTHKLLTGRRSRFETLRRNGGLSGFPRRRESPFDPISTGHSSTSISAGLGISCAKELKNERGKVIAVIGDGAMSAGMAYEGLNHAGDIQKDLLVVLNDNSMSIAPSVGALSCSLSRALSKKTIQGLKCRFGGFVKSFPKIGDNVYDIVKRSKESFKTFVTPGMLFEAFRFEYFGPIDGHNLNHLIDILRNIKYLNEPVLLHVRTIKGKGYPPAERNPVYFHGCGSFDVETGISHSEEITNPSYSKVFGEALLKLALKDERIVAVIPAMIEGAGLAKFSKCLPNRCFDVGIAEQHAVTFAAGMATEGLRPVVAIYSTFLQRALDQIIHDVCLDCLPVVFAVDRGGIVGEDGPTHHGVFDMSLLRCLPNMMVMAPKDENELCRMLATALAQQGPVAIRYPRGNGVGVKMEKMISPLPVGKAEILEKGSDIVILAIGGSVGEALSAHAILLSEGISATVVNCRYVKPLDAELIASLAGEIPRLVTVEENVLHGGFGSAVLECLSSRKLSDFTIERVGISDTFVPHGAPDILRAEYGVDAAAIVNACRKLCRMLPEKRSAAQSMRSYSLKTIAR